MTYRAAELVAVLAPWLSHRGHARPITDAAFGRVQAQRMMDWPRLESGQVTERPELSQSASTAPTVDRMTELENPLGVFGGLSVETSPGVRGMSRAAGHRLLPDEYRQLAKGAQEKAPQHSDASPSPNVAAHLAPMTEETRNG